MSEKRTDTGQYGGQRDVNSDRECGVKPLGQQRGDQRRRCAAEYGGDLISE
jgi:hypothetical protein